MARGLDFDSPVLKHPLSQSIFFFLSFNVKGVVRLDLSLKTYVKYFGIF